ncbi:MAG: TIGR00282 family metallophosphoesterase [Magnetovibrionaceae bacterium]
MRLLFLGDIMGQAGRKTVFERLPGLRKELGIDFVVANGENAAHGFGITPKICRALYDAGVDVITTGNHAWDRTEIMNYIDDDPRLLRPLNYRPDSPGKGVGIFEARDGRKVAVLSAMGQLFMGEIPDPFEQVRLAMEGVSLGVTCQAAICDMHAEATSEKMAMGHFLDGKVTAVVGSHSHIPTADAQILKGGTAYQTDAGMCGDYDSVIGMTVAPALGRFTGEAAGRLEPAAGEATLCGIFIESDDSTGLAVSIQPIRQGGRLQSSLPNS